MRKAVSDSLSVTGEHNLGSIWEQSLAERFGFQRNILDLLRAALRIIPNYQATSNTRCIILLCLDMHEGGVKGNLVHGLACIEYSNVPHKTKN